MKPYVQNKKTAGRKRIVILLVAILLIGLLGFAAIKLLNRSSTKPASTENNGETINFSPATEEEKTQADKIKEDLANQQNQTPPPSGSQKSVTPIITDAGQYDDKVEIRAYIPNVLENGGKCTYTLKKDAEQITKTVGGMAGPQTTQCESIGVPVSEFPSKGTWTLTVSYLSASSSGSSEPWQVEIK